MNGRAAGTRFHAMRPRMRPSEFGRFRRRRWRNVRRAEYSRLRRRRAGCGFPGSATQLIRPIDRRMNRVVIFAGGRRARLTRGPRQIQRAASPALLHERLRTAYRRRPSCRVFRHVESKVCEFQAGGCSPDVERRCLQEHPAYTGVERSDDRDDRQPTCAFVSNCRHGRND